MIKKIITFSLVFFTILTLTAQTAKQWADRGEKHLQDKDYLAAIEFYGNAHIMDPTSALYAHKYAESLRSYNDYKRAEEIYTKAIALDIEKLYPLNTYWLAVMQMQQSHYAEASNNFKKFQKEFKNAPPFYLRKAKNDVKASDNAEKILLDSLKIVVKNLGESLNTSHSEFGATPINDSSIYFSSLIPKQMKSKKEVEDKNYRVKIFKATRSEGEWQNQGEIGKIINNPSYHQANATLSLDKKRMYFSRCDDLGACAIYMSEKKSNDWQLPVLLEAPVNLEGFITTQPSIAEVNNKEILFFVSNRDQGKGNLDIWYSIVSEQGKTYSQPKNAGKKVNSPDNEITPFYNSYDKCLYFSSNWHLGIGGYDVFKSCGDLKSLGLPENVGVPLNSPANDYYFTYTSKDKGFLTSNRAGSFSEVSETCCNDMYSFENIPEPEAKKDTIVNIYESLEILNKYLPVTLYFHNDEPNPKTTDTLTSLNYLTTYDKYYDLLDNYKDEYSKGLESNEVQVAKDEIEDFFSQHVDKGVNDLGMFSKLLLKELEKGANLEISVKGYASPLAKTDYNVNLTLRRISSLFNYLKEYEKGVFIPYIEKKASNGGSLDLAKIPFGEYKADTTVSDNIHDQRNSIYSKKAALERKIEILSVNKSNKTEGITDQNLFGEPILFTEDTLIDFGKVMAGKKVTKEFIIKNTGNKDLILTDIKADCSCTAVVWDKNPIKPQQENKIKIEYKAPMKGGRYLQKIEILTNDKKLARFLYVKAIVIKN